LTVEVLSVEGPLGSERLDWVARLYGPIDANYARREFLEHLFAQSPGGPALHAFALDEGHAVGHCAVVPQLARLGERRLVCGKVESLVVAESHRGRRGGERPVALRLRDELYALAAAKGIAPLHAYVRPEVGRVLGLSAVPLGERSLVAFTGAGPFASRGVRAAAATLAIVQGAVRGSLGPFLRVVGATLRSPTREDLDLVAAPRPDDGRWTVLGEDAWDWYCGSPVVRVLEVGGTRALVQLPGAPGGALRLIGWRSDRRGLRPALLLVRAASQLARRLGAGTVRFQPWHAPAGDGTLSRACRLLGLVPREDFTTLAVDTTRPELARPDAIVATPLLYLGF
jgi:hypothetical protein